MSGTLDMSRIERRGSWFDGLLPNKKGPRANRGSVIAVAMGVVKAPGKARRGIRGWYEIG